MPGSAASTKRITGRTSQFEVQRRLEDLCHSLRPGDRVPTHTELMRRFQASERTVLRALEELQRGGGSSGGTARAPSSRSPALPPHPSCPRRSPITAPSSRSPSPTALFRPLCGAAVPPRGGRRRDAGLSPIHLRTPVSLTPLSPSDQPLGFVLFSYGPAPLAKELQDAACRVVVVGAPPADVTPEVPCVHGDPRARRLPGGAASARPRPSPDHLCRCRRGFGADAALAGTPAGPLGSAAARRDVRSNIIFRHEITTWARSRSSQRPTLSLRERRPGWSSERPRGRETARAADPRRGEGPGSGVAHGL